MSFYSSQGERRKKDGTNLTGDLAFCENRSDYHRQVN